MSSIAAPAPPTTDWDALYDGFVAGLRTAGAGTQAPQRGALFPSFGLPDSRGRHIALAELLGPGPIVLSFMRGGWCPYCRAELTAWSDAIPRLAAAGGRFVAVSSEIGGRAETTRCELAPAATMLCDVDHGLATALGLSVVVNSEVDASYRLHGLDLAQIYGDAGRVLPIPATYVIDPAGCVRYAFVEPDFRRRADPAVVIAVVEAVADIRATPAT